jgi:hypothetical protein
MVQTREYGRHYNNFQHCIDQKVEYSRRFTHNALALNLTRRGGRAVECTGLENQQGLIALRGFKSHPLRHTIKGVEAQMGFDPFLFPEEAWQLF